MSVKKVLLSYIFGLLLLSIIGCGHNVGFSLINLKINDIEKVDVSSPKNQWTEPLTDDEVLSLVKVLNNVNKNEIKEYNGPTIKGGPTSIIIFLKSNKTLNLTLNGDGYIYGENNKAYQVHQTEVRDFVEQVHSKLATTGTSKYVDVYDVIKEAFLTDKGFSDDLSKHMTKEVFDKTNIYKAYPVNSPEYTKPFKVDFTLRELSQKKKEDQVQVNMIYSVAITDSTDKTVGGSQNVHVTFTVKMDDKAWLITGKEEQA